MLSQYRKINGLSMAFINIMCLGAWLFGVIVMCVINYTESSKDKWETAPVGCLIVLLLVVLFKCFPKGELLRRYHVALSMSRARRDIIKAELFWGVIFNIALVIVLYGLYHLEMLLYRTLFPGAASVINVDIVLNPLVLLGGIALITVVPLFMAAMWEISKFIPYAMWMCVCFCPALFSADGDGWKASFIGRIIKGFKHFWMNLPAYGICLIFLGASAVFLLTAVRVLGRQDVKL